MTNFDTNCSEDADPDDPSDEEIAQMRASSPEERAALEALVLRECTHRWQKVARVVGAVEKEFGLAYPHLPFVMLQATVEKLEELGQVEVDGDPWALRYSEMRLAQPRPAPQL
jgi:hypothetical protein